MLSAILAFGIGMSLVFAGWLMGRKDGVRVGIETTFSVLKSQDFMRCELIKGEEHLIKISEVIRRHDRKK